MNIERKLRPDSASFPPRPHPLAFRLGGSEPRMRPRKSTGSGSSSRPKPRNYFSRREQYRLLVLVGLLCGVLWAMNKARDPRSWHWLFGTEAAVEEDPQADPPGGYDTRLTDTGDGSTLMPDAFEIPREGPPDEDFLEGDYFPGVQGRLVRQVLDDRPINRGSEYHAFYHLLELLNETSLEKLEAASEGEVGFRQMFEQTEEYRGKLVTVKGVVRRVETIEAPENEYGIDTYYRLWMETVGGSRELITAIFLELPEEFPTKQAAVDVETPQVEFTGFFYKREPYQSNRTENNGMATAPLVLAKLPNWLPPPPPREPVEPPSIAMIALAVVGTALGASLLAAGAWHFSRNRSQQAEKYSLTSRVRGEDIARPSDEDVLPSTLEALGQLAESSPGESEQQG